MPKQKKVRNQRRNNDPLVKKPANALGTAEGYNIHKHGVKFKEDESENNHVTNRVTGKATRKIIEQAKEQRKEEFNYEQDFPALGAANLGNDGPDDEDDFDENEEDYEDVDDQEIEIDKEDQETINAFSSGTVRFVLNWTRLDY